MIDERAQTDHRPVPPLPAYNLALRDHLRATEPELWDWFAAASRNTAEADRNSHDDAEVELLKTAYRMEGGIHDVLCASATLQAHQLGLDREVVLYQELRTEERNARVFELNGRIHIVFGGDLLELLDEGEQRVVLAHELAHVALWERENGDLRVLDHMIHRLAAEAYDDNALVETARRLRLHTEAWADWVSVALADDLGVAVSTIVKIGTGLRRVEAGAYLRQANQILETDPGSSRGLTHPEMHIRVAGLAARSNATTPEAAEPLLDTLISGDDDLDRLDLLGQLRVQRLIGRVLNHGQTLLADRRGPDPNNPRTHRLSAYLANYPELTSDHADRAQPLDDGELSEAQPSIRQLTAAFLVDLAMACEDSDSLDDLRRLSGEADRLGVATEFDRVLAKATDRSPAETKRLRNELAEARSDSQ